MKRSTRFELYFFTLEHFRISKKTDLYKVDMKLSKNFPSLDKFDLKDEIPFNK